MTKIKWLHLSDLHFGSEKEYNVIETARTKLLAFIQNDLSNQGIEKLFITGDLISAPTYMDRSLDDSQKETILGEIITDAVQFIKQVISFLHINNSDVFIVPGNHDIHRDDALKPRIEAIVQQNLENESVFTTDDLDFLLSPVSKIYGRICTELNGISYCEHSHKLIEKDEYGVGILLLNTVLTAGVNKKDLLLDADTFRKEWAKHDPKKPIIILAHHSPDWFSRHDKRVVKECTKNSDLCLYLCGHEHTGDNNGYEKLKIFYCGSSIPFKVSEGFPARKIVKVNQNDTTILVGEVDSQAMEATISSYKFRKNNWGPNRDMFEEPPYNKITIETGKYRTILDAPSETAACVELYNYLIQTIIPEASALSEEEKDRVFYVEKELEALITTVLKKREHIQASLEYIRDNLLPKIQKATSLGDVTALVDNLQNEDRSAFEKIAEKADNVFLVKDEVIRKRIAEKLGKSLYEKIYPTGILLYSKSAQVIELLKQLPPHARKNCTLYICEGSVRNKMPYQDSNAIRSELYNSSGKECYFDNIEFIPDITFKSLMLNEKIDLVLLGSHQIFFDPFGVTSFDNTIGSGLIVENALDLNIPCYVIALSRKFRYKPEEINKPFHFYEEREIPYNEGKMEYSEGKNRKKPRIKFFYSEIYQFDRNGYSNRNNVEIIADSVTPGTHYKFIQDKARFEELLNSIVKDKRSLELINNDEHIVKVSSSPEEREIEHEIVSNLFNTQGLNIPEIYSTIHSNTAMTFNYYKGIRVFNFLVLLKKLMGICNSDSDIGEIRRIAQSLLKRCADKQKLIQKQLYDLHKKSTGALSRIQPYPKSKIDDMVELFFACFNLDTIDQYQLRNELDLIYQEFSQNAKVPFRDSTTKNMIINDDDGFFYAGKVLEAVFIGDPKSRRKLSIEQLKSIDAYRLNYIKDLFEIGELQKKILEYPIFDVDFSSCIHLTTPSDDVISLKFHECTYEYSSYKLLDRWNDNTILKKSESHKSIAATFIIRFLRFGGRKALYRIFLNKLHKKRFMYDNDVFYFEKLPEIIRHFWKNADTELHATISLFEAIAHILSSNKPFCENKSEGYFFPEFESSDTYFDVFPY